MGDFPHFIKLVVGEWFLLMSGPLSAGAAIVQNIRHKASAKVFWILAGLCVLPAFYYVWENENSSRQTAESELQTERRESEYRQRRLNRIHDSALTKAEAPTAPGKMGDENTIVGNVRMANMGSRNTIVGPTDSNGNTFITQPGAYGFGAQAGPGSIAIGANARAGNITVATAPLPELLYVTPRDPRFTNGIYENAITVLIGNPAHNPKARLVYLRPTCQLSNSVKQVSHVGFATDLDTKTGKVFNGEESEFELTIFTSCKVNLGAADFHIEQQ